MQMNGLGVVIPAYNAEKTIGNIVKELIDFGFEAKKIIVIDDGSQDKTSIVVSKYGTEVIRNNRNMGKGAALNKGFDKAIAMGLKRVITLDADGQHQVKDTKNFIRVAEHYDLVIGMRLKNSPDMPFLRRIVNRITSLVISILSNNYIPDVQSGFRLINLEIFKKIVLKTKNFQTESELVFRAIKYHYSVGYVPITTLYNSERSYIKPFIDTLRFINMAVKFLWG
ncbi:MAG: glycosyltransferase family 2 protein [bacterium]